MENPKTEALVEALEDEIMGLAEKYRKLGLSLSDVVSAVELRLYSLREELEGE